MLRFYLCTAAVVLGLNCISQKTITYKQLDSLAKNINQCIYKKTADTALHIYYLKPANKNKKNAAVIWIHGGAWKSGLASTHFAHAAFTSLNQATGICIEYRRINTGKSDITDCILDCMEAISFIKKHADSLAIDTNKIVLIGESAGGHLAACLAMGTAYSAPVNLKALVLLNPVLDLFNGSWIKYMNPETVTSFNNADTTFLLQQSGAKARSISPLYLSKRSLPPTLILNGTEDKITPAETAIKFADSLQANKKQFRLKLLPQTGHAFAVPHYKNSEAAVVNAIQIVAEFLQEQQCISNNYLLADGKDPQWIPVKR